MEEGASRNSRGQQTAEGPPATAGVHLPQARWQVCQVRGGVLLWERWGTAVRQYHWCGEG